MIEYLENCFLENKDKIAYKINEEEITYQELLDAVRKYSLLLKKQGNSPIIIYGHKSISMIISIFASIFSKRTYIPIDTCTPTDRIQKIIEYTGSNLIIANEEITMTDIEVLKLEALQKYQDTNIKESNNDMIYTIFTSGSTGSPKGVPISEKNLLNFIHWIKNLYPLKEYQNCHVLNQASFSFDLSVADLFYALGNGHTLVGLTKASQENYNSIFDVIKENEINVMVMTPTFIKLCLLNNDFNERNYPFIKCLYFCGEVLDKKTVRKIYSAFPNISIINAYGPTEATSAVTGILITKEMLDKDISLPVGKISTAATEIVIENDEIILKGDSVFNGYIDNISGGYYQENQTNCYKTGDLGYIKNDFLYFIGRKDNQIKYKGYRIELGDIEENINNIMGVKDCAVVTKLNDDHIVKIMKAFVVLENGYDEEYVKEKLTKMIPHYMIPKIIKKIDKLPLNQNGKIDRKMLSEL